MAALDERGKELTDRIEAAMQEALEEARFGIEALEDLEDPSDAVRHLAEAARLAQKAEDAQERLDNLS